MSLIACMKEYQVSGTLSGEWCGHLAWREQTSGGFSFIRVINKGWHG
jgi:inosine/xanthosine triphosphate pyrophosphatase family protein